MTWRWFVPADQVPLKNLRGFNPTEKRTENGLIGILTVRLQTQKIKGVPFFIDSLIQRRHNTHNAKKTFAFAFKKINSKSCLPMNVIQTVSKRRN